MLFRGPTISISMPSYVLATLDLLHRSSAYDGCILRFLHQLIQPLCLDLPSDATSKYFLEESPEASQNILGLDIRALSATSPK